MIVFRKRTRIAAMILSLVLLFTSVFCVSAPDVDAASSPDIDRIFGTSRVDTAIAIADKVVAAAGGKVTSVVIANGNSFADALAGVSFAASKKAPILLTAGSTLETANLNKIKSLAPSTVYIFGGTGAVSSEIESQLKSSYNVVRLAGASRYDTAVAINSAMTISTKSVFIVSGENFPDALSAAPVAGMLGAPILYSNSAGTLTNGALSFIKKSGITKAYVIGGTTVIGSAIASTLKNNGVTTIERVAGTSRYDTSRAVYNKFAGNFTANTVAFATGTNFPDALSGGVYAALTKTPLILVTNTDTNPATKTIVKNKNLNKVTVFGGYKAVSGLVISGFYGTEFELDVNGSTGYVVLTTALRKTPATSGTELFKVSPGKAFVILEETNKTELLDKNDSSTKVPWLKVKVGSTVGYIDGRYCMINLPDVMPSLVYDITTAYNCLYKSSGYSLSGITGKGHYKITDSSGKVMNNRLGYKEFIAPVSYHTAKMIAKAAHAAFLDGYIIKIYDLYRSADFSQTSSNVLKSLYNSNSTVKKGIQTAKNGSSWGTGWFLASSFSSHNSGAALDVSLVKASSGVECTMPTAMHELSTAAVKYTNASHKTGSTSYAASMTDAAKYMDGLFVDIGMTTLASEWWHFQDQDAYAFIRDDATRKSYTSNCKAYMTSVCSVREGTAV